MLKFLFISEIMLTFASVFEWKHISPICSDSWLRVFSSEPVFFMVAFPFPYLILYYCVDDPTLTGFVTFILAL